MDTFSERVLHWQQLLGVSLDSPVVGAGLGSANIPLPFDRSRNVMPHNDYVRSAVEFGYPATVVYILFLVSQLFFCVARARGRYWPAYLTGSGMQVYIMVISVSQNVYGDLLVYPHFMAFLAIIHRVAEFESSERPAAPQSDHGMVQGQTPQRRSGGRTARRVGRRP